MFCDDKMAQSGFWTIFGLVVALTFDILISKSFISVSKCIKVVHLAKFPKRCMKYCSHKDAWTDGLTDARTTREHNATNTVLTASEV